MAKKRPTIQSLVTQIGTTQPTQPSIPANAALSFLKGRKGTVTWSVRDLANTLKINLREAEQVVTLLAAQGYAQADGNEWMTTSAGESVSNARPPRFARERVEQAVESLKERGNFPLGGERNRWLGQLGHLSLHLSVLLLQFLNLAVLRIALLKQICDYLFSFNHVLVPLIATSS